MTNLEALTQLNLTIRMVRPDLNDLPHHPLPPGYELHWYEPGDGQRWVEVQQAAEKYLVISPELFLHEYGTDAELLHQRLFFLRTSAGEAIATTAAWYTENNPAAPEGLIHWVAIKPTYQGRGLGNSLMNIACERMRQLGHQSARLTTSTARIAAINLYRKFGFQPTSFERTGEEVWRQLDQYLKEA